MCLDRWNAESFTQLRVPRRHAAAALTNNGEWLITGGENSDYTDTSEKYRNGRFELGAIPHTVSKHCVVSVLDKKA